MNAALSKAQAVIKGAIKDKTNPAFKSKYADMDANIEAIRDAFAANELAFRHELSSGESAVSVECWLLHSSGEERSSGRLTLPILQKTPQAFGSAITYGRRYTLQAVAGVAPADDDDGNAASKEAAKPPAGIAGLKRDAPEDATHDRAMSFKFGNGKGKPLSELADADVQWYRTAIKRDLADPTNKYGAQNTIALAALEAELRFRGLPA